MLRRYRMGGVIAGLLVFVSRINCFLLFRYRRFAWSNVPTGISLLGNSVPVIGSSHRVLRLRCEDFRTQQRTSSTTKKLNADKTLFKTITFKITCPVQGSHLRHSTSFTNTTLCKISIISVCMAFLHSIKETGTHI